MFQSDALAPKFARSPLTNVICQLRFSPILSIDAKEPVAFQEKIREHFPLYTVRKEQTPPRMVNVGGQVKMEPNPPMNNYCFASADGKCQLSLTKNYIAFTTSAYTGWEDFAKLFDVALAEFIRLYRPAFFEYIGLRYLNAFSRTALGLEDTPWRDLFEPAYLGPLLHEDVPERNFNKVALDTELALGGSCRARIHSGTGLVKRNVPNAQPDNEVKFLLDLDISMIGQTEPRLAAAGMETLHRHASSIFMGAMTDTMREALDPQQ